MTAMGGHLAFFPACCDRIEALGGLTAEGLFRVPGSSDVVTDLLEQVSGVAAGGAQLLAARVGTEAGAYDGVLQACTDVNDAASLLTKWLREENQLIPERLMGCCGELASPPLLRAVLRQGFLEKKGGEAFLDGDNALRKERHWEKGGRRNWKRRWFVLYTTGEFAVYSELPAVYGQQTAPPDEFLKRTELLATLGHKAPGHSTAAECCSWRLVDAAEGGDEGEQKILLTLPGAALQGPTYRRAIELRAESREEAEAWIAASIEAVGAGVTVTTAADWSSAATDAVAAAPCEIAAQAASIAAHTAYRQQWEADMLFSLPQRCEDCLRTLPQPGQALLRALIGFLQKVDPVATMMTTANLGMVFGISVIRRADPMESMKNVENDKKFIMLLLENLKPVVENAEEVAGDTAEAEAAAADEAAFADDTEQRTIFATLSRFSKEQTGKRLTREEYLDPERLSAVTKDLPPDVAALVGAARASGRSLAATVSAVEVEQAMIPVEHHALCMLVGLDSICTKLAERFQSEVSVRQISHKRNDSLMMKKVSDTCVGFDREAAVLFVETIWLYANDFECGGQADGPKKLSELLCDRLEVLGVFAPALGMVEHQHWDSPVEKWDGVCVFREVPVDAEDLREGASDRTEELLEALPVECKERLWAELGFLIKTAALAHGVPKVTSAMGNPFLPGMLATWMAAPPTDLVTQAVMKGCTHQLLMAYEAGGSEDLPATKQPMRRAKTSGALKPLTPEKLLPRVMSESSLSPAPLPPMLRTTLTPDELEPEPEPELEGPGKMPSVKEWALAHVYSCRFPDIVPPHGFVQNPTYGWERPPGSADPWTERKQLEFTEDGRTREQQSDGSWVELVMTELTASQIAVRAVDGLPAWCAETQCKCVAQTLADVFNARSSGTAVQRWHAPINFGAPHVLQMEEREVWYTAEPPTSSSSAAEDTYAAYSHLTYEASAKRLVVVAGHETECCVHTCDQEGFGERNQGHTGMRAFLSAHVCNDLCLAMGLPQLPEGGGGDQVPLPLGWEQLEDGFLDHNTRNFTGEDPRYQPGDKVEYLSFTHGNQWLQAAIRCGNPDGTINLDLRDNCVASRVRRQRVKNPSRRARLQTAQMGERSSSDTDCAESDGEKTQRISEGVPPRLRARAPSAAQVIGFHRSSSLPESAAAAGAAAEAEVDVAAPVAAQAMDVTGLWLTQPEDGGGAEDFEYLWLEQEGVLEGSGAGGVVVTGKDSDQYGSALAGGDHFTCKGTLSMLDEALAKQRVTLMAGNNNVAAVATLVFVQEYADGSTSTQWKGLVTPHSQADGGTLGFEGEWIGVAITEPEGCGAAAGVGQQFGRFLAIKC